MRKLILTSSLVAALFAAAACGTEAPTTPPASPSPSIALKSKAESCASLTTANEAVQGKMLTVMGSMFEVLGETDEAKIEEAMKKVVTEMKEAVGNYKTALEKELPSIGDAEVKAQVEILITEMDKMLTTINSVTDFKNPDNMPEMESEAGDAASEKLETLCA